VLVLVELVVVELLQGDLEQLILEVEELEIVVDLVVLV
jgi:hypothetical protein